MSNTESLLRERVEQPKAYTERQDEDLRLIISELQRKLQPGGSPPSGGPVMLAYWIIAETHARIHQLETRLEEMRRERPVQIDNDSDMQFVAKLTGRPGKKAGPYSLGYPVVKDLQEVERYNQIVNEIDPFAYNCEITSRCTPHCWAVQCRIRDGIKIDELKPYMVFQTFEIAVRS